MSFDYYNKHLVVQIYVLNNYPISLIWQLFDVIHTLIPFVSEKTKTQFEKAS